MEKYNTIRAVLFDFDGTLFFLPTNYDRMKGKLKELFLRYGIDSDFRSIVSSLRCSSASLEATLTKDSLKELAGKADQIIDDEELQAVSGAKMAEGVADILEWLRGEGKKIAIITRNGSKCVREVLKKFKIPSPDFLVSRSDVSRLKPEKEHGEVALKKLNLKPEECVIVGDSSHDVELGRSLDIPVILVDHDNKAESELKEKAAAVITSLAELKTILKGVI